MSGRKRFFTDAVTGEDAVLDGDEFVHAVTVQRVAEGDEICLLDGSGREFTATITKVEKKRLTARISSVADCDCEPRAKIYLLVGALKGNKTELVVQKACELGVGKIGVFSSEYCSAYLNANKLERLNKVAREATKQCMRARAPEIEYFDDLASALESARDCDNALFACEFASSSEADLSALSGTTAIVVGSEGGFSEAEFALARRLGFAAVHLGKRILRAETAAIALTAIVAHSLGEMQ